MERALLEKKNNQNTKERRKNYEKDLSSQLSDRYWYPDGFCSIDRVLWRRLHRQGRRGGICFEKIVKFLERRFTGWQETIQQ